KRFRLADYLAFLEKNAASIASFTRHREAAFAAELARWHAEGQFHFDSDSGEKASEELPQPLAEHQHSLDSPVSGSVWQQLVPAGTRVKAGTPVLILESMKMELEVTAACDGILSEVLVTAGQAVQAGQRLAIVEEIQA